MRFSYSGSLRDALHRPTAFRTNGTKRPRHEEFYLKTVPQICKPLTLADLFVVLAVVTGRDEAPAALHGPSDQQIKIADIASVVSHFSDLNQA